jgi:thiol-disulfide isomerase/thioredoxin
MAFRPSRLARHFLLPALAAALIAAPEAANSNTAFPFRVPSLSGGSLSDQDFRGKIVIVDVWATWCGPCRMVIPHLVELQEKYRDKGVAVVGLNADTDTGAPGDAELINKFVRRYAINYPIGLMNPEAYREVAKVMGFDLTQGMSIPTTIILGRNGRILKRYPGYFYGQEREIEAVISGMLAAEEGAGKKP